MSTKMAGTLAAACAVVAAMAGCTSQGAAPAAIDPRNDACAHCRMVVVDGRFAAQIAAPGEEPRFFDDIGCLRSYLEPASGLPPGAIVFVASYPTKAWIPARAAVYLRSDAVDTPMGSHLVAFGDAAERDADPASAGGERLSATGLFGGLPLGEAAP
jgi:copper chaperone NosL